MMVGSIYNDDLSETWHETRLITINAGIHTDELVCTLVKVSLDKEPQFEALSYAWGDRTQTSTIAVNGSSFAVAANLEVALRHLRLESLPRVLWVDAICINQHNVPEKILKLVRWARSTDPLSKFSSGCVRNQRRYRQPWK